MLRFKICIIKINRIIHDQKILIYCKASRASIGYELRVGGKPE